MFGKYFSHVLVLTLLAGTAYSLPQVKDAMGDAFAFGYTGQAAVIRADYSQPVNVKDVRAKVVYDSKHQESTISITAKVQVTANDVDLYIADNSFYFNLNNKTLSNIATIGVWSSKAISNLSQEKDGYVIVKKGTTTLFSVTASVNPSSMIAGQYQASLSIVSAKFKLIAPLNKSNTITVVGENSPYITIVGQGIYGTKDTIVLNSVRAGRNASITFQQIPQTCPVNMVCPTGTSQTYQLRSNDKSDQIRFSLANNNIKSGSYLIYITNQQLGPNAGKSNILNINILDQSKLVTAEIRAGKLALIYDSAGQESSLTAPFEVNIKAGDRNLTFDKYSFNIMSSSDNYSTGSNVSLSANGQNITSTFTLRANEAVKFKIVASINPKNLFAGAYTMSLSSIYASSNNSQRNEYIRVLDNKTNSVIIIGETSPYVNSITPNPAVAGQKLSVNGVRLNDSGSVGFGTVYLDGNMVSGVDGSKDGSTLFFVLSASTTDGNHMLSVKNANGASNTIWFQSTGGVVVVDPPTTPVCPAGYICSPVGGTTYTCPSGFTCTPVVVDCPAGYSCTTQTPTVSALLTATNLSTNYNPLVITQSGTTSQSFSFKFNLTAGNYPMYVSKTQTVAISTVGNLSGISVMAGDLSADNSNGDSSTYFMISPGATKIFTATYRAVGMSSGSGSFGVSSINYGTSTNSMNIPLNTDVISSSLKAILFH